MRRLPFEAVRRSACSLRCRAAHLGQCPSGAALRARPYGRKADAPDRQALRHRQVLLDTLPATDFLHADKGYDSDAIRRGAAGDGVMPNLAPKRNRRWRPCLSAYLYRNRNAIERMFGRLKDFRRIATRYDRLAVNYLAAICLAATVCYWFYLGYWARPHRHTR